MIAISRKRSKEDRHQPRLVSHNMNNRETKVHFAVSENNRFCRLPSQHPPSRDPLEIIGERRHIRGNLIRVPPRRWNDDEDGQEYPPEFYRAVGPPDAHHESWPFRRTHPSQSTWHPKAHGFRVHRSRPSPSQRRDEEPWTNRKSPVVMKPISSSASYWGWKDQNPRREQCDSSSSQHATTGKGSTQTVAITVSNDDLPPPQKRYSAPGLSQPEPSKSQYSPTPEPTFKRQKGLERLDILVRASLEMGPMHENPTGCSCPKSKCVALYCECFKAGRRCDPNTCTCSNCKNTIDESGPEGARTVAIRSILARNPRAFLTAGTNPNQAQKLAPGDVACNCIRSRCLKLYCTCFQQKKICKDGVCSCVGCLNTKEDTGGDRKHAIESTLEKRPDAFETRTKEVGLGCACKNNRCIRKYCECFRNQLACNSRCSCKDCENHSATGSKVAGTPMNSTTRNVEVDDTAMAEV